MFLQRFQPRHVVTMVVAVSIAAVLTPVGVMAATGQLVNIADGSNAARLAKVNATNELAVAARPSGEGSNITYTMSVMPSRLSIGAAVSPNRIALTQLMITTNTETGLALFEVRGWARMSGTGNCSTVASGNTTGFSNTLLRRIMIHNGQPFVANWTGPALLSNAAGAGNWSCLTLDYNAGQQGASAYIGTTTFTYTP